MEFNSDKYYFREYSLKLILQNVVMGLMMAADKIIAALFIGVNALVATNLIGPLQMMIYAISTLFMSGLGSYVGLLIGRKDINKANRVSSGVLLVLTVLITVVTAFVVFFAKDLAYFVGARGDVLTLTTDYLYYVSIGFIAMVLASALDILIMNDGHPGFIMKVNIATTVLNLSMNVVLVAVFNMGIIGLAISTTISNMVHLFATVVYFRKHSKQLKLVKPQIEWVSIRRIVYNGSSDFLGMFSEGLKRYVVNIAIITFLTPRHMEAYSVVSMFVMIFISSVYYGTALGIQPIFSQMMGAMRYERLKPLLSYTVRKSNVIALAIYLLVMPIFKPLLSIFIQEPQTLQIGMYIYITFGFATLFENLPNAIIMFFTAINRPLESVVFSISRTVVLLPVLTYICTALYGQIGLMLGTLIAEIIIIVVSYSYVRKLNFDKLTVVS